jgi:hypothetical protein
MFPVCGIQWNHESKPFYFFRFFTVLAGLTRLTWTLRPLSPAVNVAYDSCPERFYRLCGLKIQAFTSCYVSEPLITKVVGNSPFLFEANHFFFCPVTALCRLRCDLVGKFTSSHHVEINYKNVFISSGQPSVLPLSEVNITEQNVRWTSVLALACKSTRSTLMLLHQVHSDAATRL